MRFSEPLWLAILPLLWIIVYWGGKKICGIAPLRRNFVMLLRSLIFALLIMAMAGVQAVRVHRQVCTIFALDVSDSIPESERKRAIEFISEAVKNAHANDKFGVVVFGRQPIVEVIPAHLRSLPPIYAAPDKSATDIASALRLCMALFPDGYAKRIVLLSDGNETDGDAQSVAVVARTENVAIDTVPLSTGRDKEVLITDVIMPSEAKIGQPFPIRVIIEAMDDAKGILRIDRDGIPVKELTVQLVKGKNAIVESLRVDEPGISRLRVVLEAAPDSDPRNNIGMGLISVKGKPRVLLADSEPNLAKALENAMKANDLDVTICSEGSLPTRVEELGQYDAIIFSDFPAYMLSEHQMKAIQGVVRDAGVGFVMIGGEKSFLPGGYYGTPIAEILPVDLDVRQRRIFPAATIVIVMDTSGSMAALEDGVQKVYLAAKAAIETLKMLRPIDRFGVIVSGEGADWLSPIRPAGERERIIEMISRIYASGGGIYCRPSLELAAKAIVAEVTRVRHIIFLADTDDCDEQEGCFEIAHKLRSMGVTITAVGFGRPDGVHAPFLRQLAHIGGGNYYVARFIRDLPKLFTADVSIMTRFAIVEGAFLPKIVGYDESFHGIDWQKVPPLLAYNLTSDKPLARTLMRTDKNDPLLAIWQFGLGTSIAFTSDAKPRWARQWMKWGDFSKFWANIVRSSLRKASQANYMLTAKVHGGKAVIELEAYTKEGEPINLLQPEVRVLMPNGECKSLMLQQEGLGKYKGQFPATETGVYLVTVVENEGAGKAQTYTAGFSVPYPSEYRFVRANIPLLRKLAELTGGKFNPNPRDAFALPKNPGESLSDLWQLCVWLALALLLVDIAARRIVLGLDAVWELFGKFSEVFGRVFQRQPAPSSVAGSRLLLAKQRAKRQEISKILEKPAAHYKVAEQPSEPSQATESQKIKTPSPTVGASSKTLSRLLEVKRQKK